MAQSQQSALVTGAGSGIGAATAVALSELGYFVYLLGRDSRKLENVAKQIPQSQILVADLIHGDALEKAIQPALHNSTAPLTALINNAGIFERHDVAGGTDEVWRAQFETNLLGAVRITRLIWPKLEKQKKGSIVNVSSTLGLKPTADTGAYSAVKAAMVNWTQSLALAGGPHGIRANCVCPGIVDTPIHPFHKSKDRAETLTQLAGLQPLGRIGTPVEVASSIAFLASDLSSWTTGAVLSVDGGIQIA